VRPDR